jgi:mannosyltransferase OCH1-like enzyme
MINNKIIHQIWYQDNTFKFDNINDQKNLIFKINQSKIPKKYKKNSKSWIINNKEWKYILWNSNMINIFLFSFYPKLLPHYKNLDLMIMKIDFIKYIILYHYGGIYCDIDTICLKNIDPLIKYYNKANILLTEVPPFTNFERLVLSLSTNLKFNTKYLNNGILLSKKKHPFWIKVIDDIINKKYFYPKIFYAANVFEKTGPLLLINSYYKYKKLYPDLKTAKYYFLEPCFGYDIKCKVKPISFSVHKHDANWIQQLPKDTLLNKYTIKFWYKNILPISRDIYFSYLRDYKKIVICFCIILLIILILYGSNLKNGLVL